MACPMGGNRRCEGYLKDLHNHPVQPEQKSEGAGDQALRIKRLNPALNGTAVGGLEH